MANVGVLVFVLLPLAVALLAIPVLIGVYVYRDAKRRGMNAVLWTIVAVFVPSLTGFIIYLLVRGNYSDMVCARCEERVSEEFVVCPNCGARLRPSCPGCGFPVEADWSVCPRCAAPLPERQDDIVWPIRHADRTLPKILVLIIAVPALLILLLLFSFSAFSTSRGVACMMSVSIDDYFEQDVSGEAKEEVRAWLDQMEPEGAHAYALCYGRHGEPENEYYYLVYVPDAGNSANKGIGMSGGLFGKALSVDLERTGDAGSLLCISASAQKRPRLKIKVDGKKIPCEVTGVDFEPTGIE